MPKSTEQEVHEAIKIILSDKKAYCTSLNYAVNYCQLALIEDAVKCALMLVVENELNYAVESVSVEEHLTDEKENKNV